jgi:hypothetical protein
MAIHRIVRRGDAYRIETTALNGRRWLLHTMYPTEQAAQVRLGRLHAMAKADIPEREMPERQRQEDHA